MVSNRTLAVLIVASLVISLGGALISLNKIDSIRTTGFAGAGSVNLTIGSTTACVVHNNVTFGSSNPPNSPETISTDWNNTGTTTFTNCISNPGACGGLVINNTGNIDLNVTLNSSAQGAVFIGGSAANSDFVYYVVNGTNNGSEPRYGGGCRNATVVGASTVPNTETMFCKNLTSTTGAELVTLEFNVTVPSDVTQGSKVALITIGCSTSS
jgi:hypothetical protein